MSAHNKDYVKYKNKRHKNQYVEAVTCYFSTQQPVMEALETESFHEFVMP
jgi:hypothetical protein